MRWDSNSVREGMFVNSIKGERIGKVIRRDEETFVVEKGTLFPKDYELRYDHIANIEGGEITYSLGERSEPERRPEQPQAKETRATTASPASDAPIAAAAPVRPAPAAQAPAPSAVPRAVAPKVPPAGAAAESDTELRIPLMQEELQIEKVPRQSGHVRIHKEVKTEERHFTVPVRREEIVIEHVTAFAGGAGTGEPVTFEEQTLDIPLHEEEIRVTKRPVLREEIVVRTVAHSVEQEASATLRHEEADVEDMRRSATEADAPKRPEDGGYSAPGKH